MGVPFVKFTAFVFLWQPLCLYYYSCRRLPPRFGPGCSVVLLWLCVVFARVVCLVRVALVNECVCVCVLLLLLSLLLFCCSCCRDGGACGSQAWDPADLRQFEFPLNS
ncbi:unnamed protein product [Polarella glacialis]|uniref:Uncharacterized protein n=1 Tax=Polarella glacialis TaxID=89957 RepID=A0A813JLU4_POLGL|nr:unnamed protein product [Polarella glacialis]CAE8678351.1 unnamed protein product [Polarella glacialis]